MRALRAIWRTVRGSWKLAAGLVALLILALVAVFNNALVNLIGGGQNPLAIAADQKWLVPSPEHWLGTDQYGRDVLAMVIDALAVSLQVGAIAGVISTVVGVIMAFVAGYKGGAVDGV